MAKTKTILVDGKEITFKSSAGTPRAYRLLFKRDIFMDLQKLAKAADKAQKKDNPGFEIEDLELFENVAYVMAKSADSSIGDIESWLDNFSMFSIYEILPEILELWGENMFTQSVPVPGKKK